MPPNGSTTELENAATASGSGRWKEQYLAGDLATHGQHSSHPTQGTCTLHDTNVTELVSRRKAFKHLVVYETG